MKYTARGFYRYFLTQLIIKNLIIYCDFTHYNDCTADIFMHFPQYTCTIEEF